MTRFARPADFHRALEDRLRARDATPIVQKRNLIALQRFLARLMPLSGDAVLKGGLGIKLRDARARATRDLDVRLTGDREDDQALLFSAARSDAGDFFTFALVFKKPLADGVGNRFQCTCSIAGRRFADFAIDAVGPEPMVGPVSLISGTDWLDFAGVPPPRVRVYPLVDQIAEKVHALTQVREPPNTRDKDLPDLAILARLSDGVDAKLLRQALESTFTRRLTHALPPALGPFPPDWLVRYPRLALDHHLEWAQFDQLVEVARAFIEPVLNGSASGSWNVGRWRWA